MSSEDDDWPFEELGPAVLDGALPDLPDVLPVHGQAVLTRWVGPRWGAVLRVRHWGPEEGEGSYLELDAQLFRKLPTGWDEWGGGGTNWHSDDPGLGPPDLRPEQVELVMSGASIGDGRHATYAIGVAGTAARWLEVVDREGTVRRPLETRLGHFVVVWTGDAAATLRVLDDRERVLAEFEEAPEPWWSELS